MANIDESLYSRQLYAIGKDTTQKLINSRIFVYGVRGATIEILKNLILCGVGEITLYDKLNEITERDIEYMYYLNKKDINKPILDVLGKRLTSLNPNVKINKTTKELSLNLIKKYSLVLFSGDINDCSILNITDELHNLNLPYIVCNTYGVFGNIFCDFGEKFISYDTNGEKLLSGLIVEKKDNIYKCQKQHDLTNRMEINLIKSSEKVKATIVKIIDRFSFQTDISGDFDSFEEIKVHETFNFKSLRNSIEEPEFVITDYKNFDLSENLHNLLLNKKTSYNEEVLLKLNKFIKHHIQFIPMNSVIGGIVAHTVISGVSNKYTPIKQFLYFGCLELIDTILFEIVNKEKFEDKLFIVGAGALGCEHLKNLASYGFDITITDMDSIEKSNLNRQFLFRNSDIGKFKSVSARDAIMKMFPDAKVTAHVNKVCEETSNIYNEKFYSELSVIINALDNIPARLYVDTQCVTHNLPLFESGTLGTKGNVQVIIPEVTESYGSTVDTADDEIPICTLKNHPYLIEHCIQWAKELFQNFFVEPFSILNKYNNYDLKKVDELLNKSTETEIDEMYDNLELFVSYNTERDKYISDKFDKLFNTNIINLLELNPIDKVDEEGNKYWSGTKKIPIPIKNTEKTEAIDATYKEYIETFFKSYKTIISRVFTDEIEYKFDKQDKKSKLSFLMNNLKHIKFNIEEFEKDDDTNSHIDFIMAASNLRAINYQIKPITRFETKGIAGKIIPALSTTTSVISGLVALEFFKYLKYEKDTKLSNMENYLKVENFNNYYVNLGIQYYGNSEPIKCKSTRLGVYSVSMWTQFASKCKTINELIDAFHGNFIQFNCINIDKKTIYSNFMNINFNKDEYLERGLILDALCQGHNSEEEIFIQIKLI